MADDPKANISAEKATQDEPMPSSDQKTPEVTSEVAPPDASLSDEPIREETTGLPDDSTERTRREFEKLRQQLREERSKRLQYEGVYQQTKVPQELPSFYNPDTGEVDINALSDIQRKAYEAEQRAQKAEQLAQNLAQQQEEREAYLDFPELNRADKNFDKDLHRKVRATLLDAMVNPGDYPDGLTMKQAAQLVKGSTKDLEKVKQEAAKQALEELTPKEQASLEATGSPGRRGLVAPLEDLRSATRKGDIEATVERLKRFKQS